MNSLKQKLEKLDSILIKGNALIVQHFNSGIPRKEIISFLQSKQIKPFQSLVTLYEWHNGVKTVYGHFDCELNIIPNGSFFNLNEMLRMREVFRDWAKEDFDNLDDYIPFLGTGESDMFILNTTTGQVLAYQPMIQIYGELAFHSIESMIDCVLECF